MPIKEPNLFIIGAPKSGTTSLSAYLSSNPEVFFAREKEPHFFSADFESFGFKGSYTDYLNEFFDECPEEAKVVAEGSTWYYCSEVAVRNILEVNPEAKFIFMIRDPVEMLNSLYWHKRRLFTEDQPSFRRAWEMETFRKLGGALPECCREPRRTLLYSEVASFGYHLHKLRLQIPEQQLKVILFDDLRSDARQVYLDVLQFLSLEDDGCACKEIVNPYFSWRSPKLGYYILSGFDRIKEGLSQSSSWADKLQYGLAKTWLRILRRLNRKKGGKPALDETMKKEIRNKLSADMELLSNLLGRGLDSWRDD